MDQPGPVLRELVEQAPFTEATDSFSKYDRRNEVIRGALWAIATNAEAFPITKGFKDIRILKTDPIEFGPSLMPGL